MTGTIKFRRYPSLGPDCTHPKPFCFVCRKPVERITKKMNLRTMEEVITVSCHGETEQTTLTLEDQMKTIERGVAFRNDNKETKRLPFIAKEVES
ncbi:hypothetical protein LCGC14_0384240 [marine sediment metagenome]|uniref:Uncharacterized protein n=1 Tax=marine sediment metagenome TaxID=412755 RepID=A0A0F9T198_9ZZZZ